MSLSLGELLGLEGVQRIEGDANVTVSRVTSDSRLVQPGDLFAAVPGATSDGASYAQSAIERGARAVLANRALGLGVPTLVVDDVRHRLGPIAQRVFGEPSRELAVVGITGTNGKTTVSYLLESVLAFADKKPALLGTIVQRGPAGEVPSALTTPEADTIARFMREQRDAGATHLCMEVSSHALDLHRVLGTRFQVAAFLNLTQDHLDHHGSMEAYGEAKARLFTEYAPAHSVIVVDHPFGEALSARAQGTLWRCSVTGKPAEIVVRKFASTRGGIVATIDTPKGELELASSLFGAHNLENLLVCIGCALALDIELDVIRHALAVAHGAPGRMERVPDQREVMVLVDYAHTPDALERALTALRPLTSGRLFVLAGCGGDRDRTKRAPMGEAAARLSDVAVLTSDNPRTEDPLAILAEMEQGAAKVAAKVELERATRGYTVIADRAEAIRRTVQAAGAGDTILIAGKGHEAYQIIGKVAHPFDDRTQALKAIVDAGGLRHGHADSDE